MDAKRTRLLIVEDDQMCARFLQDTLQDAGFCEMYFADDGEQAWQMLQLGPTQFDLLLLDRYMPKMDGLELLRRIKAHKATLHLPIIMQTAAAGAPSKRECLDAGAYYYLTKPYNGETLLTILSAAIRDLFFSKQMQGALARFSHSTHLMQSCDFRARTLEDAMYLGSFLAHFFPQPDRVVVGLTELLINGIEHGNLEISYLEKGQLVQEGRWEDEIKRRLNLQKYRNREMRIHIERDEHEVRLHLQDEGGGFEWQRYLEIDPARAQHPHGRGIAIARTVSFDNLRFNDIGNEVTASCRLDAAPQRLVG